MNIKNDIKRIIKKLIPKKARNLDEIRELDYDMLKKMLKENGNIMLVDVRSIQEHRENQISPSINIPLYELESKVESILKDKNQTIILYCKSGMRSRKAYKILKEKGYTNLYTLEGGIEGIT